MWSTRWIYSLLSAHTPTRTRAHKGDTDLHLLGEHQLCRRTLHVLAVSSTEWRHALHFVPVTLTSHTRMLLCKYQASSLKRRASDLNSGGVLFESPQDTHYPCWGSSWFFLGLRGRWGESVGLRVYRTVVSYISESVIEFLKLCVRKLPSLYRQEEQMSRTIVNKTLIWLLGCKQDEVTRGKSWCISKRRAVA